MSTSRALKRWIEIDQLLHMVGLRRRTSALQRVFAGAGFAFVAIAVGVGAGLFLGPSYGRRLREGLDARVARMRAARSEHAQAGHIGHDSSPHG